MMRKGLFITFEGIEGSGKTTLLENVGRFLEKKKISFIKTREPGSTVLGEKLRNLVLHTPCDMSPYAELCLFLASRAQHIKDIILPALKNKKIVLCDRFNDSTVVYQGYARDLDVKKVSFFCDFISENLKPDLTFYLDLCVEKGLQRVSRKWDRIEKEKRSFHEKVKNAYLDLIKKEPERFFVLDANKSKEEIQKEVVKVLLERI